MAIVLKIKKLHPDVKIPKYEYEGDAGLDLRASDTFVLKKGEIKVVLTGIQIEIPEGYVGFIWDKSGLAIKYSLKTMGGVIDSGYRGEIMVGIINLGKNDYVLEKGHKVAQMIIQKKENVKIKEVKELGKSHRGVNGFGSSGK